MRALKLEQLSPKTSQRIEKILREPYDASYKRHILELLEKDPKSLEPLFSEPIAFGTGGIRGLMGIGTNQINEYTIEIVSQGVANYLIKQKEEKKRVFISYDNRKNSFYYAKIAAAVFAGNQIEVYIVKNLRPTPLCSFGCLYYHCTAAVMITASHNPPEYNGYKVYWKDGAQVLPPHDQGIIDEVKKIERLSDIKIASLKDPHITWIGEELDQIYLKTMEVLQNYPKQNKKLGKSLHIVYSNLHGTGITLVPQLLKSWGFTSLALVKEQVATDPSFPSAKKPNPEEEEALSLGVELLMEKKGDLLLATDPDADRVGCVVRHQDKPVRLTGNQIACLCLYHLLESRDWPDKGAFISSIVTSDLFEALCKRYRKTSFRVLTGFKYIGEKIREWEKTKAYRFIFGAEESLGYLLGSFVRDKDGVVGAGLIAEAALHAKEHHMSLVDLLYKIYALCGVFREKLLSFPFKGDIRKLSFEELGVVRRVDYLDGIDSLPPADVLTLYLEDQSKITLRPSGTEPKMKVYLSAHASSFASVEEGIQICDERLDKLSRFLKETLGHQE